MITTIDCITIITKSINKINNPMQTSRKTSLTHQTPLKKLNAGTFNQEKHYTIEKLHHLFIHYCSRGSKYGYQEMNQKYFMELMNDVYHLQQKKDIPKNSPFWLTIVNLYYGKAKKQGFRFVEFLELMPVLGLMICEDDDQNDEAELLKNFMGSLLRIYEVKVYPQIKKYIDLPTIIHENTQEFLDKLLPTFTTLYKLYFSKETSNQFLTTQPQNESFEDLLKFLKDFEVYPKLASASQLFFVFDGIMKREENGFLEQKYDIKGRPVNIGRIFTMSKFVETIVGISIISLQKLRELENPEFWQIEKQKECLKTLLEYMQTTKTKQKSLYKNIRFSFIVYDEYPISGQQNFIKSKGKQSYFSKSLTQSRQKYLKTSRGLDFFQMFQKMDF